jgi:hypothetical protein
MKNLNKIIGLIVAAVIVGGVAFWGGLALGQGKKQFSAQNFGADQRGGRMQPLGNNGQMRKNGQGGGFLGGEILDLDDKSLTVKLNDGGSKIVFLSASTTVNKMAEGSLADLAVGTNIMVTGSANSDGSILAQSIQIRPAQPAGNPPHVNN